MIIYFSKATHQAASSLKDYLQTFQQASGQQINYSKSAVAFYHNTIQVVK